MEHSIDHLLEEYKNVKRDSLIPILQHIQDTYGYISEEAIEKTSRHLNLPASKIFGLATFYSQFRFTPPATYHLQVCHGTTCHMHGASEILKEIQKILHISSGQSTPDNQFSLEELPCLGACGQGPVLLVNKKPYPKVSRETVNKLITELKQS